MPKTKKLELPPALRTRATNQGRVVGAPDMPRPKRTPQEVAQEQAEKEKAAADAKAKHDAALARIAVLEALSSENAIAPSRRLGALRSTSTTKAVPASSAQLPSPEADTTTHTSKRVILKMPTPAPGISDRSGPSKNAARAAKARKLHKAIAGDTAQDSDSAGGPENSDDNTEPKGQVDEEIIEAPTDDSGDEYIPEAGESVDDDEGLEKGGSDLGVVANDSEDLAPEDEPAVQTQIQHPKARQVKESNRARNKGKNIACNVGQAQGGRPPRQLAVTVGGGKRKPEEDAHTGAEHQSANSTRGRPAFKKSKKAQPRTDFVQNWEEIVAGHGSIGASTSGKAFLPDVQISRRSHSVASSASGTAPPSSRVNSITSDSDDGPFLAVNSGFADDGENTEDAPVFPTDDDSESLMFGTGSTIQYRERAATTSGTIRVGFTQNSAVSVAPIEDILTKIVQRTPAPNPSPRPASLVKSGQHGATSTGKENGARKGRGTATSAGGKTTKKSKITDLPPILRPLFNDRFVPLVRQYMGVIDPWQEVTLIELQNLHRKAFGADLSAQHPLEQDDHCWKLIHYRMDDWHSKFAATAIETFQELVAPEPSAAGSDSSPDEDSCNDHELDHDTRNSDNGTSHVSKESTLPVSGVNRGDGDSVAFTFTTPEEIGIYAKFLLGDQKKAAPFYWKKWGNGVAKTGRLQSAMIVGTFAHHMNELLSVKPVERVQEYARGALALAVVVSIHALKHHTNGVWDPPEGRAGYFSEDNYSDTYVFENGKYVEDKRLSRVLKVIANLKDEEWSGIYTDAYAVVQRRRAQKGRGRGRKRRSKLSAAAKRDGVTVDEGAGSDSDELMLIADIV
ncbi:hypothetical protein C8Q78DRAFT_992816 [Trametes maxima]|nr:hypothetical protein C8Q78DRAFT_992816 [Trametes maxima]